MNRRVAVAGAILLAFIVAAVLDRERDTEVTASGELARHLGADYDYYINGMLLDRFGPDDAHLYTLEARRVTHFPAGDLSELEEPTLDWHAPDQAPWQLESRRGNMRPDSTRGNYLLELNESVHASTLLQDGRVLDLYTSRLELAPASKSAHTAEPVRMESSNLWMEGTGMQIDMNEGRVHLLADVRAQHEPRATP